MFDKVPFGLAAKTAINWQPTAMSRSRLISAAGTFPLLAACVLPCDPLADYVGNAMSYQDPTDKMLEQQAAQAAAIEHQLVIRTSIASVLAILGLTALIYALRLRRSRKTDPET